MAEAIGRALAERRSRLRLKVLEREIWSKVPKRLRGKRLSRRERERILGYGPLGV
jgi:hypothetical protein